MFTRSLNIPIEIDQLFVVVKKLNFNYTTVGDLVIELHLLLRLGYALKLNLIVLLSLNRNW